MDPTMVFATGMTGTNVWWDTNLPARAPAFYRITTTVPGP
jgi:hypothetical protein